MKESPNIAVTGGVLFLVCAVIASLVFFVFTVTEPVITKAEEETRVASFQEVFSDASEFTPLTEEFPEREKSILEIYEAKTEKGTIGFIYIVSTPGYEDKIKNLVAIDSETNKVKSIIILQQNETPGLGAKSALPEFKDQFSGLSTDKEVLVVKNPANIENNEIQAITASTITSTAVVTGVNEVLAHYEKNLRK